MKESSALDDMRTRIQSKLAARQKGIPPSGKPQTTGSHRAGGVYPQRSTAFQESPREVKLMQSPPPGPLFSSKEREDTTSGRRYLIPTSSSSQSFEVTHDISGSPELLRQNEELRNALQAYKLKLQQAEFQLKKQKKWLLELSEIKDNINILRTSGQPTQSRDTVRKDDEGQSMEMRSPVDFASRQRKEKLMSFSEYEEGQEDDEEGGEEEDQQHEQWKEMEQELASVRVRIDGQHKEEVDKLRGELQVEREKGIQLQGELSETIAAKDRYLRDLLELRKQIEEVREKEQEIVHQKGELEQQIASLKNNLDTTEKELREQRTERSYSQADCQRRINELEETYERKIQDLRRQYDEELLDVKLRAGTGLSRFILKPGDSKSSESGTPLGRQQAVEFKDEYLKLKEYCSQLQKVNTLLNNENRTAIAMLTRICSPSQLENLSQAINLVINSNAATPATSIGTRSMRGSSGVSRIPSAANLYEPVNNTMPSILYESYQFTSVAPRVTS